MRIAVISDTHNRLPGRLLEELAVADEIWHLGDVCEPAILGELEMLQIPLVVVMGNCDGWIKWPLKLRLERGGWSFLLCHIPPENIPSGVHAVLHGHTHVPRDEMVNGVRWLSPGCVTKPRDGSEAGFGWLTVRPGKPFQWDRERLLQPGGNTPGHP